MTVRDMIKEIQIELRDSTELHPTRASELLMKLTALLGNCSEQIRHCDAAYAGVLLDLLGKREKANRARIEAETTSEYLAKREARDTHALCLELARSLKVFIRSAEEEMRLAK